MTDKQRYRKTGILFAVILCLVSLAIYWSRPAPAGDVTGERVAPGDSIRFSLSQSGPVTFYCDIHGHQIGTAVITGNTGEVKPGKGTIRFQKRSAEADRISVSPGSDVVWINLDSVEHEVRDSLAPQPELQQW